MSGKWTFRTDLRFLNNKMHFYKTVEQTNIHNN